MEWMNRGDQRQGQPAGQVTGHAPAESVAGTRRKKAVPNLKGLKIAHVALLFSVTALLVAVVWFIALGGSTKESSYVDKDKLQAVFLNGGQVYFGDINDLNNKYLSMENIYYLRVNQQVQPNQSSNSTNDISLVKLGCELHGPQDNMVINREQVIFWENLKPDGQVAKAVENYKKQNPGEQKCDQASSQNNSNSSSTNTDNTSETNNNTQNQNSNTNQNNTNNSTN